MAYTKTEYELASGFSDVDVLDKMGEVFFGLGLMDSATGWFDSFTDTNGSEVRILEMEYTGNVGAYNKVYHAFFMGSPSAGLWYTVYYSWDVVTHESGGSAYLDHISSYEHPDDTNDWANYYAGLSVMPNASVFTITTYEDGGNIPLIVFSAPGESRVYGFVPTGSVLRGTDDYSYYGPGALLTVGLRSYYSVGTLSFTDRSITGRAEAGTGSRDWTLSTSVGSHYYGGSSGTQQLGTYMTPHSLTGLPSVTYRNARNPFYTMARGLPSMTGYYDCSFGLNLAAIMAKNDNSFVPSTGDSLIIDAGVEEYQVLLMHDGFPYDDWAAIIARTV